jgi:NAD(P)-dependent dehydrogenase (short-subunit alcohol dehydrogenase family)
VKALDGKVALVTGGGSGIGQATAIEFATQGAKVVVADINCDDAIATTQSIAEIGAEGCTFQMDVSNAEDVSAAVQYAVSAFGRLDIAFNNAGIAGGGGIEDCTEDLWDKIIDTNLKGIWLCLKYEIPLMLSQKCGAIVNTASIAGLVGFARSAAYTSSKHGVIGLTKSAALEYAESGIRINAVCPGLTRTPMLHLNEKTEAKWAALHPLGRVAEVDEIACAVVWLCSDAASFVTGAAIPVDGGYIAK